VDRIGDLLTTYTLGHLYRTSCKCVKARVPLAENASMWNFSQSYFSPIIIHFSWMKPSARLCIVIAVMNGSEISQLFISKQWCIGSSSFTSGNHGWCLCVALWTSIKAAVKRATNSDVYQDGGSHNRRSCAITYFWIHWQSISNKWSCWNYLCW